MTLILWRRRQNILLQICDVVRGWHLVLNCHLYFESNSTRIHSSELHCHFEECPRPALRSVIALTTWKLSVQFLRALNREPSAEFCCSIRFALRVRRIYAVLEALYQFLLLRIRIRSSVGASLGNFRGILTKVLFPRKHIAVPLQQRLNNTCLYPHLSAVQALHFAGFLSRSLMFRKVW